jgi:Holliday junction resolvase RusA-like endonuclease
MAKKTKQPPAEPREVMFEVFMAVEPKQTKKNATRRVWDPKQGGYRTYTARITPEKVVANAEEMKLRIRQFLPVGGPLRGPLKARYVIYETFPKQRPTGASKALVWPRGTKPDCDNLAKQISDVLEACGFFAVGDSQIFSQQIEKYWVADEPSLLVHLTEWDGGMAGAHAKERQLDYVQKAAQ